MGITNYWERYPRGDYADGTGVGSTAVYGGYVCPTCGVWVPSGEVHYCWVNTYWRPYYPTVNKTEQAFRVLKKLVEEKIIPEPKTYKKFCDLIEKIAQAI